MSTSSSNLLLNNSSNTISLYDCNDDGEDVLYNMIRQNKPKEFYKLLFYHQVQMNFKYSDAISYLKQLIKLLNNDTIFTKPRTSTNNTTTTTPNNDIFNETMNLEKILYLNRNITCAFKVKHLNFMNTIVYFLFLNYYSKTALILFLESIIESIEKHKHTSVDYLIIGQGLRTNYQNKKAKYYFKLSYQLDKLNFLLYLYLSNVNRSKGYSIYQNRYIELGLFKISQEIRLIEQYKITTTSTTANNTANTGSGGGGSGNYNYLQNYIINQYEKQLNEIYSILYLNRCVNLKSEPLSKIIEISHRLVFQSSDSYLAWFYLAFFYGFELADLIDADSTTNDDIKHVKYNSNNNSNSNSNNSSGSDGVSLIAISDIQDTSELYKISLYYFRKAFKHLVYPHSDIYLPLIFENIGMIYENDNNLDLAGKYYNAACAIGENTNHYWAFSSRLSYSVYRVSNYVNAYYDALAILENCILNKTIEDMSFASHHLLKLLECFLTIPNARDLKTVTNPSTTTKLSINFLEMVNNIRLEDKELSDEHVLIKKYPHLMVYSLPCIRGSANIESEQDIYKILNQIKAFEYYLRVPLYSTPELSLEDKVKIIENCKHVESEELEWLIAEDPDFHDDSGHVKEEFQQWLYHSQIKQRSQ